MSAQPAALGAAPGLFDGEAARKHSGLETCGERPLANIDADAGFHAAGVQLLGCGRAARNTGGGHVFQLLGLY